MPLVSSHTPPFHSHNPMGASRHAQPTQGMSLECQAQADRRTVFLDTTNPNKCKESSRNKQKLGQRLSNKVHLPHRATHWRQGETAALHDTQKKLTRESSKMRKQRNMPQMKEKGKTLEKKTTNEMEISNLPDKEFKAMVIKCSLNLGEQGRNTVKNSTVRQKI